MLRCASCLVPKLSRVRYGTISARRRHCCSRAVRGLRGEFIWKFRKPEVTRRSVQCGKISVHVSRRERQSRSTEVSARLRVREKLVSRMRRSRECCHIKHVGTRHSGHSEHMYFHHFNKRLHCSLQLIVSIVFETLYASSDYGSAHPADRVC